jgi:hypothetical protein
LEDSGPKDDQPQEFAEETEPATVKTVVPKNLNPAQKKKRKKSKSKKKIDPVLDIQDGGDLDPINEESKE